MRATEPVNLCDEDGMYLSLWRGLVAKRRPWRQIAADVERRSGVPAHVLIGREGPKQNAEPRHELMWRMRDELGLSPARIGQLLDERDRSTVIYGIRQHEARLQREFGIDPAPPQPVRGAA